MVYASFDGKSAKFLSAFCFVLPGVLFVVLGVIKVIRGDVLDGIGSMGLGIAFVMQGRLFQRLGQSKDMPPNKS